MAANTPVLFTFLNGEFLAFNEASLHVSDLAIQRGYGVFDFLKVQNNTPLFLPDYLERLYASADELNLEVPYTKPELQSIIQELLHRNGLEASGIKIILTGGYAPNGYDPAEPNLIILQQPLVLPDQDLVTKGIQVMTHEYVRELPHVKTINYTMGIRLQKKLREANAAEVLYHMNGVVTEFPRCNFFIVKQDGTIATPARNILRGVTRKNVLMLAAKKYKTEEGEITLQDVKQAREAFLTSTTKRILPVVKLDDTVIGSGKPGKITLALLEDLIRLEIDTLAVR